MGKEQKLRGQGWKDEGRRQGQRREQRRSPRRSWVEGSGFGDTRKEMNEEVGGKGGEWERTPSLRPGSPNTEVGGDGATRPKWGHRVGGREA